MRFSVFLAVGTLDFEDLHGTARISKSFDEGEELTSLESAVESFERRYIQKALEQHRWAKGKTAESLAIDPKTLYRKMKKIGLL